MKKSTKLLSVILAIIMIFSSMSVMAFAARTNYKTSADLEALDAYSGYGSVTRLSTEERMSIIFDSLDNLLADANINLGTVFNALGLSLTIDLRSVDALLGTVDSVHDVVDSAAVTLFGGLLGIVKNLNVNTWPNGMTRDKTDQLTIVMELLEFLNANAQLVHDVINSGELDVGVIGNFVDLSGVEAYISDIPALIKGLLFPLFERKDDTSSEISYLTNTGNNIDDVLTTFVKNLFVKPQSTTTYKENADGVCISNHNLPTTEGTRYYYVRTEADASGSDISDEAGAAAAVPTYTCYVYDTEGSKYVAEAARFFRTEEVDADGNGTGVYFYKTTAGDTLKYYEEGSYWLESLQASGQAATIMDISTNNGANMLYQMIPYVFQEMAPVVLNGSAKMLLATAFGATKTSIYAGEQGAQANAAIAELPQDVQAFFTAEAGSYLWEWSDYMTAADGTGYYRFVEKDGEAEQWFEIDTTTANAFLDLFNLDWEIGNDFLNEFIPTDGTGASTSAAGYTTILEGLNDVLYKAINTALSAEAIAAIGWVKGDNSNLLSNLRKAVPYVCGYNPEYLFGTGYQTVYAGYIDVLTSTDASITNQEILGALAAVIVKALMPQITLPSAAALKGQSVGAVLACVVRELATQFLPDYNYDALIYTDYNSKTLVTGKDNSYWLDVVLTMGVDIGMSYLTNLADLGEDVASVGGYSFKAAKVYTETMLDLDNPTANYWEAQVDWIIDWALEGADAYEWTWNFEKMINTTDLNIDLASPQDPWAKLDRILNDLLPLKQIINCTVADGEVWTEVVLRDKLVMSILDLDVGNIVGDADTTGLLHIPTNSVLRTQALLPMVVNVVQDLLNTIFYKLAGNTYLLDYSKYGNTIESLLRSSTSAVQDNLANLAKVLIQDLYKAGNNGLLDIALPIVNFFLGWSTDAQKFESPAVSYSNTDGMDYMYTNSATVTSTVNFRNDSSGMLLRHGADGSYAYDQAYTLTLKSVESDVCDFTVTAINGDSSATLPVKVEPGTTASLTISGNYDTAKPVKLTYTYEFQFKDGTAIGGEQSMTSYQYVSNAKSSTEETYDSVSNGYQCNNTGVSKVDVFRATTTPNAKYTVGSSVAAINNISIQFNQASSNSTKYAAWVYSSTGAGLPTFAIANQDFVHGDNENSAYSAEGIGYFESTNDATPVVNPLKYDDAVDVSSYVSGSMVDLGQVTVTWHNHKKDGWGGVADGGNSVIVPFTLNMGTLLIKDTSGLQSAYESYINRDLSRVNFADGAAADAAWDAYTDALAAANARLIMPEIASTFAADFSVEALEALAADIDTAYQALMEYQAGATYTVIEDAMTVAEPDSIDTNYQDYRLYEYWDYEEARTTARNVLKQYAQPTAPSKYIDGCWLDAEQIDTVTTAESNATVKDAISNAIVNPTDADMAAYAETLAAFTEPTYTALQNADTAARVGYYKAFLAGNEKAANKQFLASEIACANAQGYVEADYTAKSWARYAEALATATTVNNDGAALPSQVFEAKYGLMKAQRDLKLAANDYLTNGDTTEITALIEQAKGMFTNAALFELSDKATDMTLTDAWTQLLKATGYTATVTNKDGTTDDVQLFSGSAEAFLASELYFPSAANDIYISEKIAALKEAMANFQSAIKVVPNTEASTETEVNQTDLIIDGITKYLGSQASLLELVKATEVPEGVTTTLETTASKTNGYGTGAQVVLKANDAVIVTYTVVIYGDVNGDSAIDVVDLFHADRVENNRETVEGAYLTAADITGTGAVSAEDYAAILADINGSVKIAQVHATQQA